MHKILMTSLGIVLAGAASVMTIANAPKVDKGKGKIGQIVAIQKADEATYKKFVN